MTIEFGGRYGYEHFRAARAATGGLRPAFRWMLLSIVAFFGVGLLAIWFKEGADPRRLVPYLGAAALIGFFLAAKRMAERRAYEGQSRQEAELQGTADAEGLETRSERSSSKTAWSHYQQVTVRQDVILLHQSPQIVTYFPRSFFASDQDFARFAEWAKAGIQAPPLVHGPTVLRLLLWVVGFVLLLVLWTTLSGR